MMTSSRKDQKKIKEILKPLIGREAWGVELGYGSFLTLEFGNPVEVMIKPTLRKKKGEWNIWLYGCVWRVEKGGKVIIGSEDPHETLSNEVNILNGRKLLDVIIEGPAFDATFVFENNLVIRTFQVYTGKDEMEGLYAYFPDHHVLTVGPGENYSFERSDI